MAFWVKSWWFRPFSSGKRVGFMLKIGMKKAKEYLLEGLK
jgi:hypothetical protein